MFNSRTITLEQQQILQSDAVVVATPLTSADHTIDLVLGTLFFFWSILQQTELQKSIHVVGVLSLMFAVYAIVSAMNEQLNQMVQNNALNRVAIAQALLRVFYMLLAYLSGLFVRMISDPIINGPHLGGFGFIQLIWPLVVICVSIVFIAHIRLSTEHRPGMVIALQNEYQRIVDEMNKLYASGVSPSR
jgi:hypothetical protein